MQVYKHSVFVANFHLYDIIDKLVYTTLYFDLIRIKGDTMIEIINSGGLTSAIGFKAGATYAGLKARTDSLDLGIVISECDANVAATFTSNSIESPSVSVSRKRLLNRKARAVIVNSGCANCSVGNQGYTDAEEMTMLAASHLNINSQEIFVASTGMIGVELPMALIRQNIGNIKLTDEGGDDFSKSIMTTDTRQKQRAVSFIHDGKTVTMGAAAKGVGMIHPNMATMLCFVTTDANVEQGFLQETLSETVNASFNMIDVDGDQSTNDMVIVLANGKSDSTQIKKDSASASVFMEALNYVCTELAKELVRDGEGAQRLIEVTVEGAKTLPEARVAAREIASSLLVKAMVHGKDPNWGRIVMALGKSEIELKESELDIFINNIHIVHNGTAIPYLNDAVVSAMSGDTVNFKVSLNMGDYSAIGWGCDLTEEYVIFNSAYST
jgi:glutamate N-acetyltransferase/amino-acid N-acetyltransferase